MGVGAGGGGGGGGVQHIFFKNKDSKKPQKKTEHKKRKNEGGVYTFLVYQLHVTSMFFFDASLSCAVLAGLILEHCQSFFCSLFTCNQVPTIHVLLLLV